MDDEWNRPGAPIRSPASRKPEAESGLPMIGTDRILRSGMPQTSVISRMAGAVSNVPATKDRRGHAASVFGTAIAPAPTRTPSQGGVVAVIARHLLHCTVAAPPPPGGERCRWATSSS